MTRLAVLSDLHVEKAGWNPPPLDDADLVVLAGDVGWGLTGIAWIAAHLAGRPVVLVAGNREHWHHPPGTDPIAALRHAAAEVPGLRLLQDDRLDIAGVTLLGCTLWTDFAGGEMDAAAVMEQAGGSMPDYRLGQGPDGTALSPAQVLAWHRRSRAFLEAELARPRGDRPMIVVSHHAPTPLVLPRRRPTHVPQIASFSGLDEMIGRHQPQLWIHGHTHADSDLMLGATRILSRQRGGPENETFAPLMVEV